MSLRRICYAALALSALLILVVPLLLNGEVDVGRV